MAGACSPPQHVAGEETGLAARRWGGSTVLSTPRPCQAKGEALCSQLQAVLLPAASLPAMAVPGGFLLLAGVVRGCRDLCCG